MSDVTKVDPVQQAPVVVSPEQVTDELDTEAQDAPEPDEKQLNALLRKAESAFKRGNEVLLVTRVECGKWCHAVFALRQEQGHKDREFTTQLIFNRLAVHADSKRECDANELARMYKAVEMLGAPEVHMALRLVKPSEDADKTRLEVIRKNLTVGKLIDLTPLVKRVDGTELYGVFNNGKLEQAKALFAWACGDGINKPSRHDIHNRVLELTDPEKYAVKQAEKAAKEAAKEGDAPTEDAADDAEEAEAPDNLISTEPDNTRPMPDWKDIGENMAALYQEAVKQSPGHAADVMADFAKRFVWTSAMVKGLVAGIADSKDGAAAEEMLQELVDNIGDEYGIFAAAELKAA